MKCWTCHGKGKETFRHGPRIEENDCGNCNGTGRQIKNKCGNCKGSGVVKENVTKDVQIASHVKEGFEIIQENEGHCNSMSRKKGKLIIKLNVEKSEEFERKGPHIFSEVEMTYAQALMGGSFRVNTIWGAKKITIKGISKSEELLTLPNYGIFNHHKNTYGNQYVKAKMAPPKKLTDEMKKLYEELRESGL